MAKRLNDKQVKACQLLASGTHTKTSAYIGAGYSPGGGKQAAYKFFLRKEIKREMKRLRKQHAKAAAVDAEWIRKELVRVHESAFAVGDHSGCKAALDTLNRMNGNYEKDNKQKAEATLTMQF